MKSDIGNKEKIARNQEIDDLKSILATKEGRRVIWRFLERTGIYRNPFSGNQESTAFNCGMLSVGQWVLDECLYANQKATGELIVSGKILDVDFEDQNSK